MKTKNAVKNAHGNRSTKSQRAGTIFPVGRIKRKLKEGRYAARISDSAAVSLTGCLQYLIEEIVDIANSEAGQQNQSRITPRHILLVVRKDNDLSDLFKDVTIPGSGWFCSHPYP